MELGRRRWADQVREIARGAVVVILRGRVAPKRLQRQTFGKSKPQEMGGRGRERVGWNDPGFGRLAAPKTRSALVV